MIHYKKLKTQKVLNLWSINAVQSGGGAGRNLIFEFYLPYDFSTFSKNTELTVENVSFYNNVAEDINKIYLFRCAELSSYDIYDTEPYNAPIIFHLQPLSSKVFQPISYKVNMPLNKLTIIVSDIADGARDYGVDANDKFMMTLTIKDYDIEEVEPQSMPIVENYSHIPQMKIKY